MSNHRCDDCGDPEELHEVAMRQLAAADALAEAALYVDSHTDADRVFDLRTANARYLEARKSE